MGLFGGSTANRGFFVAVVAAFAMISGCGKPALLNDGKSASLLQDAVQETEIPSAEVPPAIEEIAPTSIAYPTPVPTYTNDVTISSQVPVVTGGTAVTGWTILPDLEANTGLDFDSATGVISGKPTIVASIPVVYTVTASNSGGSAQGTVTVQVIDQIPVITYTGGPYSYQAGTTMTTFAPNYSGVGTPASCAVSPALPAGVQLSNQCVVSGTPTGVAPSQTYNVTPTNSGGTGVASSFVLEVSAAPPSGIGLTGSSSYTTSTCAPYTVLVKDPYGNPSAVTVDTVIALSDAAAGGAFYDDAICASPASTVQIGSGNASATVYYKKPTPGAATLTALLSSPVSPALTSGTKNVNVTASTPARYRITGPETGTSVECLTYTVAVLDASGNSVNATGTLSVSLATSSGGGYFSNATCSTTATKVNIVSGSSSSLIYYRKTTLGASDLKASGTGMAASTPHTVTISSGPAARLVWATAPAGAFAATTCQTYALQTRDELGNNNPAVTDSPVTIDLSGVDDGSFYSAAGCAAGTAITQTTIPVGLAASTIYYKKPTATAVSPGADIVLTAAVSGWTPDATRSTQVSTGLQFRIRTTAATGVVRPAQCLGTALRVEDELGVQVPNANVTVPIVIALSDGGDGTFHSNSGCTSAVISTVTVPANASTVNFYYKKPTVTTTYAPPAVSNTTVDISWDNGGMPGVGASRAVVVSSGLPARLRWNPAAGTASFNTLTCKAYRFQTIDENSVTIFAAKVSAPTTFLLSDGSNGEFFSNATCTSQITSTTIDSGAHQSPTFYYRKGTTGTATVRAQIDSPSNPDVDAITHAVTITSAVDKLTIALAPAAGLIAGSSCSQLTVTSRDASNVARAVSGATLIDLSASNGAAFYYDAGCTALAGSTANVTIANGQSAISGIYVKNPNTGSTEYTADESVDQGWTEGSMTVSYAAPAPTQLMLTGPSVMQAASGCGYYTVSSADGQSIVRDVVANTTLTVSSTGGVGVSFYSDPACSVSLSGLSISAGGSSAAFFARGMTAGSAQISVSAVGLTAVAEPVTISP